MTQTYKVAAEIRADQGKGASRRLRHAGLVPAILYGGDGEQPAMLQIDHNYIMHATEDESFYTSILEIKVKNKTQKAVIRDIQRHPAKPVIMHVDFQRISAKEKLRISVPFHFVDEENSPAGKTSGVVISHLMNDIEVICFPKDLPEYIEIDLSQLEIGGIVHLSDVKLPKGVELVVAVDETNDPALVSAQHTRASQGTGAAAAEEVSVEEEETSADDEVEGEKPAE